MKRVVGALAAALIAVMAFSGEGQTAAKKKEAEGRLPSNQYATEGEAKSRCATDTVVWINLSSRIYHLSGTKSYGKTKRGSYMCRGEADSFGYRGVRGSAPKKKAEPAKK